MRWHNGINSGLQRRPRSLQARNRKPETKYCIAARIDGDYAWLKRTDAEEEPLFIARALLPEAIDGGTELKHETLRYGIDSMRKIRRP